MPSRAKSRAKAVVVDGRTYHPELPPSEQVDVLTITNRFKGKTDAQAANIEITEEELRNFAKVYPRLYKVPARSQARLTAWRDRHRDEIRGWAVGDFFKTKEDDDNDGTAARDAGIPPEAAEEWERLQADADARRKQRKQQRGRKWGRARDDDDGSDGVSGGESSDGNDSKKRNESPDLATGLLTDSDAEGSSMAQPAQNNNNSVTKTFHAALGSVLMAAMELQKLSKGAENLEKHGFCRKTLLRLAGRISEAADKAREEMASQEKKTAGSRSTRKRGRQESEEEEGSETEEGENKEEGTRTKRAQTAGNEMPRRRR